MPRRRILAAALVLSCLSFAAWVVATRRAPAPRNLVLISIDTLRADHVGLHGYRRDTTPRLDAFARRSVWFERAVAQASSTAPSHGALLTSRYPSSYGEPPWPGGPPDWVDTLAEVLQRHGFATWGFVDGGYMRRVFGFAQGFDHFEDERVKIKRMLGKVGAWLDSHRPERFFLLVHCYDVHTPYNPPPPYDRMFVDPAYAGTFRPNAAQFAAAEKGRLPFGPEDRAFAIGRYDGGIRYTDDQIGGFLDDLDRRGLLESSVVVITSDHGEEFGEHGRYGHWQLYYHANLHVPLIIHAPGLAPRAVGEVVELVDVVPTVLELLRLPPLEGAMGRSLVPLLDGTATGPEGERFAFAESVIWADGWRTVVGRDHQLLFHPKTGATRLYDLRDDPAQHRDVAPQNPDVVTRLRAVLREREANAERRNTGPRTEAPKLDDRTRRQLEALGYVQD
jgi:arylsulfatase A-like enzyme